MQESYFADFVYLLAMVEQGLRIDERFALKAHLRVHGWRWDDVCLDNIVSQLLSEDVSIPQDLYGVDINDIIGVAEWPADVKEFMKQMCKVCIHGFSAEQHHEKKKSRSNYQLVESVIFLVWSTRLIA